MRAPFNPTKILVFLPQTAGAMIVTRLAERGYESVAVSTVPEAFDALRSDDFIFAITTRQDIDLLRNIRSLPVINLEVFLHADISREGRPVNSRRFDIKGFLERVEFLFRSAETVRPDVGSGPATPLQIGRIIRCWAIVANTLRIAPNPKDTMDVRS